MSRWKVEQMGSGGETDTSSVLLSLQCWQARRAAVSGTWRRAGSWARTPLATADRPLHFRTLQTWWHECVALSPLCLSDCSRLNSASPQHHHSFPLEYKHRRISLCRRGLHYSAVHWACLQGLQSLAVGIPRCVRLEQQQLQLKVKKKRRDTGAK